MRCWPTDLLTKDDNAPAPATPRTPVSTRRPYRYPKTTNRPANMTHRRPHTQLLLLLLLLLPTALAGKVKQSVASVRLSVCVRVPRVFEWHIVKQRCIRLVCEKLTIFPYGQHMGGNVFSLAFWRYSQVQDRSRGLQEICKNVTVIPTSWLRRLRL